MATGNWTDPKCGQLQLEKDRTVVQSSRLNLRTLANSHVGNHRRAMDLTKWPARCSCQGFTGKPNAWTNMSCNNCMSSNPTSWPPYMSHDQRIQQDTGKIVPHPSPKANWLLQDQTTSLRNNNARSPAAYIQEGLHDHNCRIKRGIDQVFDCDPLRAGIGHHWASCFGYGCGVVEVVGSGCGGCGGGGKEEKPCHTLWQWHHIWTCMWDHLWSHVRIMPQIFTYPKLIPWYSTRCSTDFVKISWTLVRLWWDWPDITVEIQFQLYSMISLA